MHTAVCGGEGGTDGSMLRMWENIIIDHMTIDHAGNRDNVHDKTIEQFESPCAKIRLSCHESTITIIIISRLHMVQHS